MADVLAVFWRCLVVFGEGECDRVVGQMVYVRVWNVMCVIKWKLHLRSSPKHVFRLLSTHQGRELFWSEIATESDGFIEFLFINGQKYKSKIIKFLENELYEIEYFNSIVTFELKKTENNGTDLMLINSQVDIQEFMQVKSGWVSVLMALKAACDFEIDLRNHDKNRSWDQFYVDN